MFDSGVGGLSVLREVHAELPSEDVWYVADSTHAPYGDKPAPYIEGRAVAIAEFLAGHGAKALVVACNTATGVAVDVLRRRFTMPIIGIEPAIKPAVALTKSGRVGVLATSQTLASRKFEKLVEASRGAAEILTQACPGLVEHVEQGTFSRPQTRRLIEQYLQPLLAKGVDTLVLGCTHYPFVADVIRSVAGPGVQVIDPARPVAKEVRRRLDAAGLLRNSHLEGQLRIYSNDASGRLREFLVRLGLERAELREFGG
jgi:glutamate racemase